MVEAITDFKSFVDEVKSENKHVFKFSLASKEYSMTYSELSSQEDIKSSREFEKWFKDSYKDLDKKELELSTALDGQWRIWKMLRTHAANMASFEEFLALPPPVVHAIMLGIQRDLAVRYPHMGLNARKGL